MAAEAPQGEGKPVSRTIAVALIVNVEIEVPDDSPVTPEKFAQIFGWRINDYTDGRHPFCTEMVFRGVRDACDWVIEETLFDHFHAKYRDWIQGPGTSERRAAVGFKVRDRHIAEAVKPIHFGLVDGGHIELNVTGDSSTGIDDAIKNALLVRGWLLDDTVKENAQGEAACFIHPGDGERMAWLDAVLAQQERELKDQREEERR
jgi:hypothetical protein